MSHSTRLHFTEQQSSVQPIKIETHQDTLDSTLSIISEARRRLCIYSPDLDFSLFGQVEVIAALKQFAIQSRDGYARIVVQDTVAVRSKYHPLIELAQRLTSSFQFRKPVEADDLQYPSAFVINDRGGFLFRQNSNRFEGHWSPTLPSRNRQLHDEFEQIWQRCQSCPEFQVLTVC